MKIKFKVSVGATTSLIIITSIALITYYSFSNTSEIIYNMSKQIISKHMRIISQDLKDFIIPIENQTKFLADVITDSNYMNDGKRDEYLNLMWENINIYDQVSFIYLADEKGNWTQARRNPELAARMIDRNSNKEIWKYLDSDYNVLKTTVNKATYDHRKRPWYMEIDKDSKRKTAYWTAPYIFSSINQPGITISYPLHDKNTNKFFGSISSDITLEKLSGFLKSETAYKTQLTFIVDNDGRIIAYSGEKKFNVFKKNIKIDLLKTNISDLDDYSTAAYKALENTNFETSFTYNGNKYFAKKINIDYIGNNYKLITVVDEKYLYNDVFEILKETILISALILLIALLLIVEVTNGITRTIENLKFEVDELKKLHFVTKVLGNSMIYEIYKIQMTVEALRKAMSSFSKYIPIDLVRNLIKNDIEAELGGKKKELTLMFTDIEGFTTISEDHGTNELIEQLSLYFKEISEIVNQTSGTVDKFIGDGTMSFWGAPLEIENHAKRACSAALKCKKAIKDLNKNWHYEGKPKFKTRFGINTGETIVGNVGSESRMNYTAMGDSVNITSRLETLCKTYGVDILISQSTYERINDQFFCRPLGRAYLKGKKEKAEIYHLVDKIEKMEKRLDYTKQMDYSKIYEYYEKRNYKAFMKELVIFMEKYPNDKPARAIYADILEEYPDTLPEQFNSTNNEYE